MDDACGRVRTSVRSWRSNNRLQATANSVRSSVAWSELCCCSGTRLTPGYCWSTSFQAPWLLLVLRISCVLRPSKMPYARHNFQHLGVRQQYPPVICTRDQRDIFPSMACTETQSINQGRVGGWPEVFGRPAHGMAAEAIAGGGLTVTILAQTHGYPEWRPCGSMERRNDEAACGIVHNSSLSTEEAFGL